MIGRRRREERRDDRRDDRQTFGRGGDAVRYKMKQRMVSIGDDFWIENDSGDRVFKVDGKALRVRTTLKFEDAHGNELAKIQERKARIKDTMKIEGSDGSTLATVKKALVTPVRARFSVDIPGGTDLSIRGNIVDHEYTISAGSDKVAEVSKKWFRVRDTYGVQIDQGQNDIVILAITVALDMMND